MLNKVKRFLPFGILTFLLGYYVHSLVNQSNNKPSGPAVTENPTKIESIIIFNPNGPTATKYKVKTVADGARFTPDAYGPVQGYRLSLYGYGRPVTLLLDDPESPIDQSGVTR